MKKIYLNIRKYGALTQALGYLFSGLALTFPDSASAAGTLFFGIVLLLLDPILIGIYNVKTKTLFKEWIIIWSLLALSIILFYIYRSMDGLDVLQNPLHPLHKIRTLLFTFSMMSGGASLIYRLLLSLSFASSAEREIAKNRKLYIRNSILSIAAASFLFIALNYMIALRNPVLDLTSGKFSLTDGSRTILKSIKKDIIVYAFLPSQQALPRQNAENAPTELFRISEDVKNYLEQLTMINSNIHVEFHNADLENNRAEFGHVSNGTIIIRALSGDGSLLNAKTPYAERRIYVYSESELAKLERELVRAILQVSTTGSKIYFTASNGERSSVAGMNEILKSVETLKNEFAFYNYNVEMLDFKNGWPGKLPDDGSAIFIIGPRVPFRIEERNLIYNYIESGGKLFITIDPDGQEDFIWLLHKLTNKRYAYHKGPVGNVLRMPGLLVTDHTAAHRATENLNIAGRATLVFQKSGYFEELPDATNNPNTYQVTSLIQSPLKSWIDANLNGKDDALEKKGSFDLALFLEPAQNLENTNKSSSGKLALFSSTEWLTEGGLRVPVDHRNMILAADTLFWLTESPLSASLTPQEWVNRNIVVSDETRFLNLLIGVILFPLLSVIALLAAVMFYRRKPKQSMET